MRHNPIFLSASVPYREPEKYPANPVAIREAVRALVAVVVPDGPMVFGGHPAISPMVWEDADSLGAADAVYIYQSRLFAPNVPREAHFFNGLGRLVWTPAVPMQTPDRNASLALMRDAMIVRRIRDERRMLDPAAPPEFPEYAAGVFVGGMDGVEDEWALFRSHYPQAPALLVASTSGAADRLMNDSNNAALYDPRARALLERDTRYRHVFRKLLPMSPSP
jgi:hypothetical protein